MKHEDVPTPLPGLDWIGDGDPRLAPWATTLAPSGGTLNLQLPEGMANPQLPVIAPVFASNFPRGVRPIAAAIFGVESAPFFPLRRPHLFGGLCRPRSMTESKPHDF